MESLVPEVRNIIISYISPKHLIKFFKKHRLPINLNFRYSGAKQMICLPIVKIILDRFSNIVVHKLYLDFNSLIQNNHDKIFNFSTSLNKINHITVVIKSYTLPKLLDEIQKECPILKSLNLAFFRPNDTATNHNIIVFDRLCRIRVEYCNIGKLHLEKQPNLRKIIISKRRVTVDDIMILSKCFNLITLEFQNCCVANDKIMTVNPCFHNLVTVRFINCTGLFIYTLLLCSYNQLKKIIINNHFKHRNYDLFFECQNQDTKTFYEKSLLLIDGFKMVKHVILKGV